MRCLDTVRWLQLMCTNGDACHTDVDVVQCTNAGSNEFGEVNFHQEIVFDFENAIDFT